MSVQVPARIRWAVDVLDVRPSDEILEVGPGAGVAVSLICDRLVDGHIMAIDRSAAAVRQASKRNAECIASGKARVVHAELTAGSLGRRFDKIFAINVNVFWVEPNGPQLATVAKLLSPEGRLYLFYEAPTPTKASQIVPIVEAALREHGFTTSIRSSTSPAAKCVEARLDPGVRNAEH